MTKHQSTIALIGGICVLALSAAATSASAGTAYLSHTGSGGTCSFAAPCAAMGVALNVAGTNGEVICLDKGAYGGATTNGSVTISCGDGLWEAPNTEVTVHLNPAGSDVVIEGLVPDGTGSANIAMGVDGQGALHLRRVRVGNNSGSGSHGLLFEPTGPATLHITDSVFYNNGGSGVLIKPQSGGSADVHMRNVRFEHNLHGLFADATNGTVNVNMAKSAAVDNQGDGLGAFSPSSASITISVVASQITGNFTNGIGSLGTGGAPVAVKIGNSQITGNVNGLATGGAGQILTLGGNQLHSNGNNGSFTGSIATQ